MKTCSPSGSILRRRLATWARRTWRSSSYSTPQTSTRRLRWVISRPRLRTRTRSSSNSVGVRWTSSPSRRTLRAARSTSSPSTAIAGWQRLDLALLLADGGEDEDRHLAPLADPPRHLDAVEIGQHQVDDRRLRRAHGDKVERLLAGRRRHRLEAGVAEDHAQGADDLRLVVAAEDAARLAHPLASPSPGR